MTMKLVVTPLLEGSSAEAFTIDREQLTPRSFVDLLDRNKALLFQNASGELTTEDFGRFVVDLKLEHYPYIGGAAPRTIIPVKAGKNIVFTANESPPDKPIPFHHELAQTAKPPDYIFFYCDTPASSSGETPIIDSTLCFRFVQENHPCFLSKLVEHGVRYTRTLPPEDDPSSPIGRSFKNTYHVSTREELDDQLSMVKGCSWEWQPEGSVRVTTAAVPAIRLVSDHASNYVFNYAFANSIIAAFLGWQDSRNDRHEALHFGNMERMPEDILQSIADFMQEHRILYQWKKGDIMALQNSLVMHSRNEFTGKRRVFASIWGPPRDEVIKAEPENNIALGHRPATFYRSIQPPDPLVFGFWKVPKDKAAQTCYDAIAAGYRRLDCACDYGNEEEVGQGIARAIKEGLCRREDLFVTSKLWNTYHRKEHVPLALARTLEDLQLTYLDEYLIHFPISMEFVPFEKKYPPEWTNLDGKMVLIANDMGETWKAMETLVDEGKCKAIGVCNFSTQLLRQLLSTCRIRPATLQIEVHPHNSQAKLVRFARDAGMKVTAFSVLGASSYIELDMASQNDVLLEDKVIQDIAKVKSKTPAQILIRWAIQRNTMPLCKTLSKTRMLENRVVFDFYLTGSEMRKIDARNRNRRYNDPGAFCESGMGTFCPIYE